MGLKVPRARFPTEIRGWLSDVILSRGGSNKTF